MQLGKYEILEEIGRGGFGVVYKARDLTLEREVALKVLHPQLTVDSKFIENFKREARNLAKISHPHVVTLYEIAEAEGRMYIAMRYLPGGSLADRLKARGAMGLEEALEMMRQVVEGLHAGHKQGVIHRDVKPGNILFDEEGQAVIADFGVARAVQLSSVGTSSETGGTVGTPFYRAPELWRGKPAPSAATDVYSLACVLFEMLCGETLFKGDTPDAVLTSHVLDEPGDLLVASQVKLPGLIKSVLEKALAKDPAQRHQSLPVFYEALQAGGQGEGNRGERSAAPGVGRKVGVEKPGEKTVQARTTKQKPSKEERGIERKTGWVRWGMVAVGLVAVVGIVVLLKNIIGPSSTPGPPGNPTEIEELVVVPSLTFTDVLLGEPSLMPTDQETSTPNAKGQLLYTVQEGDNCMRIFLLTGVTIDEIISMNNLGPECNIYPGEQIVLGVVPTNTQTQKPTNTTAPQYDPGDTRKRDADGMEQVYIPAGSFMMGSENGYDAEAPVHMVTLDAYWMDKYEVSNEHYKLCVDAGECDPPSSSATSSRSEYYGTIKYANFPVVAVSWSNADAYCNWAGGNLPTEAQWEYAARGEDGRTYPWGNQSPTCNLANIWVGHWWCVGETQPVNSYPTGASPFGVLNMAGNVWEWVVDWYGNYSNSSEINPTGPANGEYKVLRGGSWYSDHTYVRAAYRSTLNGIDSDIFRIGFRCISPVH